MSPYANFTKHVLLPVRQKPGLSLFLAVALVILPLTIFRLTTKGASIEFVPLFENERLTPSELEDIEAALAKAELSDYKTDHSEISVPAQQRGLYLEAIKAAKVLPLDFDRAKSKALSDANIFETTTQRKQRMQHLIEQEIARTIRHFDGIEEATVRLDEHVQQGLKRKLIQTTSVIVLCNDTKQLDELLVEKIRQTVAARKAGLSPQQVSVIDLRSDVIYPAGVSTANGLARQKLLEDKIALERRWATKIHEAIDFLPVAKVTVNSDNNSTEAPPLMATHDAEAANKGEPSMTVLVDIPNSYYLSLWNSKRRAAKLTTKTPPSSAEIQMLRRQTESKIQSTIRLLCSTEPVHTKVHVTSFDDITSSHNDSLLAQINQIHQVWLILPLVVLPLGLVLLLYFRPTSKIASVRSETESKPEFRVVKSVASDDSRTQTSVSDLTDEQLREKLSDAVRRDPESAARVLASWMRRAG